MKNNKSTLVYIVAALTTLAILLQAVIFPLTTRAASGYSYYRSVTINSAMVDATLTDFPIAVAFTNASNKTVANGGNIQNTTTGGASGSLTVPADLLFCNDVACTVAYDYEIETYSATTGILVAWVRIPSLSDSVDTVIYMHYGNSGQTTNQEDIAGTWVNYELVYHFNSGAAYDSSANQNDGTDNASLGLGSGILGDAAGFDTDDYYSTPEDSSLDFGSITDFTIETTYKIDNDGGAILGYGDRDNNKGITCYIHSSVQCLLDDDTDQVSTEYATDTTDNTWRHFTDE